MREYETIVVGGGPIGGYIAGNIAKENRKVAVFEKNTKIGFPLSCAGLVTSRVFDFLDESAKISIQNTIKGANIHSPSDNILIIGGNKNHALVINRHVFDKKIIEIAEKNGAEIFLGNNVLSAFRKNNHIEIKTSKDIDAKTPLLIGADGPFSKIRDRFINYKPREYLRAMGAEISNIDIDPNYVEIFLGKKVAPGFFAWIIPTNKKGTKARIGLCINQDTQRPPNYYFEGLIKNKNSQKFLKDAKIEEYIGGMIPLGVLNNTYSPNIMVVGDAAAQVKPTSGGGIYPGLLCAKHCVSTAIDCIKKNDFSQKNLKKYHKKWVKDIGKELNRGMKFRSIYRNLTDNQIDKYLKKFDNSKLIEVINKYGDIDYPSKLVKPLLKKMPYLIKFIPDMLKE